MMQESNSTLTSMSMTIFHVASQLWYFGMVYTILGTLFRDDYRLSLEMVISLSTILFLYSLLWTLRWYDENEVVLCSFTLLGLFAAFLSLARLISSPHYRAYTMQLTVFLVVGTLVCILLFMHAQDLFFDQITEASAALLVLAPSIGYQLSHSLAPLQYYVSAAGFSAFWVVDSVLSVSRTSQWWPLLLSTLTLILAVQQLFFYLRHSLTLTSSTTLSVQARRLSECPIVLQELRYNASSSFRFSPQRNSLGVSPTTERTGYQSVSEYDESSCNEDEGEEEESIVYRPDMDDRPRRTSQTHSFPLDHSFLDDDHVLDHAGITTIPLSPLHDRTSLASFYSYGSCFEEEELEYEEEGGARKDKQNNKQKKRKRKSKSKHVQSV
jgi:hypothetical protein